jgi:hypothetical protein
MGFIYKLTFPSEKSYIGQTIRDIHKRLEEHQLPSSNCVAVSRAIQKHGWENVKKEWYEVPDEDLNFYEEMLVALLGTLTPGGYNLKEGGGSSGKLSEETKKKISKARIGKTHTEETKQKIGKAKNEKTLSNEHKQKIKEAMSGEKNHFYGNTHTEEIKKKMSEAMTGEKNHFYGNTHTEETKKKMSEAKTGKKHPMHGKTLSDEHKQKLSKALTGEKNHKSKKVYQYKLDGTPVDSFVSCGEAARIIKEKYGTLIRKCARGELESAHGFTWSYVEL